MLRLQKGHTKLPATGKINFIFISPPFKFEHRLNAIQDGHEKFKRQPTTSYAHVHVGKYSYYHWIKHRSWLNKTHFKRIFMFLYTNACEVSVYILGYSRAFADCWAYCTLMETRAYSSLLSLCCANVLFQSYYALCR